MKKCPFCKEELPIIHDKRQTWCNNCGASWIPNCPGCGKPTWMSLDKHYKHVNKEKCKFGKIGL